MKMDTMNISLPKPMAEFVRQKVGRDYGNASEYFRETGPARPGPTEKDLETIERIKREVRKDLRARRVR